MGFDMKISHEDFQTGWHGVSMSLSTDEINGLIELLSELNQGSLEHFHIRSLFPENEQSGIADIEISMKGENELDNATIK